MEEDTENGMVKGEIDMSEREVAIERVLMENYLPYAESVIIQRAVPDIAGLKPVQTRILYAMHRQKLYGKRAKCNSIVGEVMKYHPNGDQAIYDAMCRLTDSAQYLLTPMIKGKGTFGKSYSSSIAAAAPRYPEATLMPIAEEFFDGLEDDAVDMKPNYDNSMKEPTILPVKFPNVLVNSSPGIAVGMASYIPTFNLRDVCKGTIGIIKGEITDSDELMDVLGAPEFPTGGFIHVDEKELYQLGRTGLGGFYMSGAVQLYRDAIIITQIPFNTTVEKIMDAIKENMKTELREIDSVKNLIDLHGLKIEIRLRGGADPQAVLNKLRRMTELTKKINFNTAVIINGEYRVMGVFEVAKEWIKFRDECVRRVYAKRYKDVAEREHKLATFEIIKDNIPRLNQIMDMPEEESHKQLAAEFNLDEIQIDFLEECKRRDFHADRIERRLKDLEKLRQTMVEYKGLSEEQGKRYDLICTELQEIADKYGEERQTKMVGPLDMMELQEEEVPDTSPAIVVITKNDNIVKLNTTNAIMQFSDDSTDPIKFRIPTNNSGTLLLFSQSGVCYKVPVAKIPTAGKVRKKEYLYNLIKRVDESKIIYADDAGDYSKSFNVIYGDGGGVRVFFDRFTSNRSPWRNCYEPLEDGKFWVTTEDKLFIITAARKAAYGDLTAGKAYGKRAFKIARISTGDRIVGIQPMSQVPDRERFEKYPQDLGRYTSGYTVLIREDVLWEGAVCPEKDRSDKGDSIDLERVARELAEKKEVEEQAKEQAEASESTE